MSIQHEAIFRRAMVSSRPQAILEVARAFYDMGDTNKANILHNRAVTMTWIGGVNVAFGAMARGTPIKGTNGAVIPPGRYWIDLSKAQEKSFTDWSQGKPEVHVESTEDNGERLFIILTIPTTANNYGLPGVFYPTQLLGFPDTAAANVQSSRDVMKVPDAPTSADVLAEMAKTAGRTTKSFGEGLGLSSTTLMLLGGGLIVGMFLLNKLMMPIPRLM